MLENFYRHYWQTGFKTRLYNFLAPEAYFESLRIAGNGVSLQPGDLVVDAGCGTGLLMDGLADSVRKGARYLGLDILAEGVQAAEARSQSLQMGAHTVLLRASLAEGLPVQAATVDAVVAHFSVYTLKGRADRLTAWKEIVRILKPDGVLSAANPSHDYDAGKIIKASLFQLLKQGKYGRFLMSCLLYPFTYGIGLSHIERQLKDGVWYGYRLEDFRQEVEEAGLEILETRQVYGGSGWWLKARKPAI